MVLSTRATPFRRFRGGPRTRRRAPKRDTARSPDRRLNELAVMEAAWAAASAYVLRRRGDHARARRLRSARASYGSHRLDELLLPDAPAPLRRNGEHPQARRARSAAPSSVLSSSSVAVPTTAPSATATRTSACSARASVTEPLEIADPGWILGPLELPPRRLRDTTRSLELVATGLPEDHNPIVRSNSLSPQQVERRRAVVEASTRLRIGEADGSLILAPARERLG
jgi:hypothetical protein